MKTNECIYVDKDAYFFLRRESRSQRGWPTMNQAEEDEIWDRINKVNNKRLVTSDSFGGGDGTSTGAWWPWSLITGSSPVTPAKNILFSLKYQSY